MDKITFFDTYSDGSGGAPRSMLNLILLLLKKGVSSSIITTDKASLYQKAIKENINASILKPPAILMKRRKDINGGGAFYFKYLFCLFIFWIKCLPNAYRMRNEKVCFNDIRCFVFFFPFVIFCRRNIIWYVRINDRVKFVTEFALRASSKIILVSNSCYKMFTINERKQHKVKFSTVYTGFPKSEVKTFDKKEKIRIGFVGVLSKRKNIELLIEALSHIEVEQVSQLEIVVVGDTKSDEKEYLAEIKKNVEKYDLSEQFKFVGFVDDVSSWYLTFDTVIMTSLAEGLPRTIIEGLSHGCYIISTDVDGAKEILLEENLGTVLNEYSPSELAGAIIKMMVNRDSILLNRHKRVRYINDNFSEKSFVNNFIDAVKN
ncbi:glycosyltransferase family 4 protein [Vibrio breoganii]